MVGRRLGGKIHEHDGFYLGKSLSSNLGIRVISFREVSSFFFFVFLPFSNNKLALDQRGLGGMDDNR